MKNISENFHLQQQQQLEGLKGELAQALLKFSEVMKQSLLVDIVKLSAFNGNNQVDASTFSAFQCQLDYIRSFLQWAKIFPKEIRLDVGWKVLRDCEKLLKSVLGELVETKMSGSGDGESTEKDACALLFVPTGQLIHDCLEMNLSVMESGNDVETASAVQYGVGIFGECAKFLVSPVGISLGKAEFLRIMGLCQKVWKFVERVKNLETCPGVDTGIETELKATEEKLADCMLSLLSSENGRSLLKFWCETFNPGKESKICTSLQHVSSSSSHFPEMYMIFTSYLEDERFWRTECGQALTPVLIRGIMQDMRGDKVETRKRAAFVLKLLVSQYSQNIRIFDMNIPEVSLISLKNMELGEYTKFWEAFFDVHDILNETQVHIVQPVLQKLHIFKEYSSNDAVLVWFPILLKKMIKHDNRSVVKEGFEQFLKTGQYIEKQDNGAYRQLAKDFLGEHIMPLIRDHIGWILNEPEEFFKNIDAFGQFLLRLYSDQELPEFQASEVIIDFLTSSGKCMGPHTIYFLVASLDGILGNGDTTGAITDGHSQLTSSSPNLDVLMNHLSLLLSNNLTTVSKYFRELLELRCVSILYKITPFIANLQDIQLNSFLFMKLLTFLGSLSVKVLSNHRAQEQIRRIIRTVNDKEPALLSELTVGSKMYDFAKSNLSSVSTIGMLRFVTVSVQICTGEITNKIQDAVEKFAFSNGNEEILPGSIQGLREFYQQISHDTVASIYAKMLNELYEMLVKNEDPCSFDSFMYCVRRLEVLTVLPDKLLLKIPPLQEFNLPSCQLKLFLTQKLYILLGTKDLSSEVLNGVSTSGFKTLSQMDEISDRYFSITERNIFAEYHQVQFSLYTVIVENMRNAAIVDREVLCKLLSLTVDEIEKCNSKGVASGLLLTKRVANLVHNDDNWEGMHLLDEIAAVGWSLTFELRKSEAFWIVIKAFVELITCPYFIKNGYLNKYADLLFEHGENVSGLPLVLVQHLVKVELPEELLEEVHQILVKAALTGGPLPKNNRVSFALWDHLRRDADSTEEDNDPENFSSDCKARLLACEKLRSNIHYLTSKEESRTLGLHLLRGSVLSIWERNDFESKKRKRYFLGSSTHRIKQRIWQLLLTLQPYFNFEISKLVLENSLSSLSTDSPQPSVRYMGEWLIILIIQRHPELKTLFFDCLDNCIQQRLGFGAFFSTICLHLSKLLLCPTFYDRALQSLATLTLSQHLTVRIYAQIALQKIYERAIELNFTTVMEKYTPILSALERASVYVSGNCSKLLENVGQDFYVNVFNSITHYRPEVIFTLLPRLSGMIKDECILQPGIIRRMIQLSRLPTSVDSDERIESESLELEKIYLDHEKSAWHLKTVVADGRELGEELPNENIASNSKPLQQAQNNDMNYQKKINPWKLLSASEEIEEYSNSMSKKRSVDEEGLIVVASLLDHLPNLGGLCRTCEIFGVHKYVISSLKVVNDQHFQSLSVSAQNWVNILEVPIRDLESFLLTYSAKGYTILGVEQANESSSLTDFTFPKKSVLLLGNEKLGIPPELLHVVDKCIEIPQVGIIRSLNVHVTGALCIWQYASQNIL